MRCVQNHPPLFAFLRHLRDFVALDFLRLLLNCLHVFRLHLRGEIRRRLQLRVVGGRLVGLPLALDSLFLRDFRGVHLVLLQLVELLLELRLGNDGAPPPRIPASHEGSHEFGRPGGEADLAAFSQGHERGETVGAKFGDHGAWTFRLALFVVRLLLRHSLRHDRLFHLFGRLVGRHLSLLTC